MSKLECFSVYDKRDAFCDRSLVIAGPGPGFVDFDFQELSCSRTTVFALNHTITELWRLSDVWWVSNDHDRTFQSSHVSKVVPPRLRDYSPWKTITQKQFIPGALGNFRWIDHRGKERGPLDWRLPAPRGSTIAYYVAGEHMRGREHWIHNGWTVLELALEIATLWGFSPIVLVGCDMTMEDAARYYAPPFRYKNTPRRLVSGAKLEHAREALTERRAKWPQDIYLVSSMWENPPFDRRTPDEALTLLHGEMAWKAD